MPYIYKHKVEIHTQRGGLGHHFGGQHGCGYHNVQIKIIDQVEHGNKIGLDFVTEKKKFKKVNIFSNKILPINLTVFKCGKAQPVIC